MFSLALEAIRMNLIYHYLLVMLLLLLLLILICDELSTFLSEDFCLKICLLSSVVV